MFLQTKHLEIRLHWMVGDANFCDSTGTRDFAHKLCDGDDFFVCAFTKSSQRPVIVEIPGDVGLLSSGLA